MIAVAQPQKGSDQPKKSPLAAGRPIARSAARGTPRPLAVCERPTCSRSSVGVLTR